MRKRRRGQKLIVAGCMSQRFSKDLPTSMPEVDAFIGLDQITRVAPIIEEIYARERGVTAPPASFVTPRSTFIPDFDTPRFRLTPPHFAYIKIAEGCNHPCTFCIIPQIRGRHRSRTVESVVAEARQLVSEGVKEINLISQDTTFFGMDTWEQRPNPRTPVDSSRGTALTSLLRELNAIEGDFWIRILYTHPAHWSDELIQTIAECPKVARYVDMPLQHVSDAMLAAMQRETSGEYIRGLVRRIRAGIPEIALRTTFIVGFPGETESDIDQLCEFIADAKFERLGVFRYSQEEGTRASKMSGQVTAKEKERRWHRLMALQRDIAASVSERSVGKSIKVLVDEPGVARGEADAPDIDGRVYVPRDLPVGTFAWVAINGHHDYDLLALPDGESPAEFKVAKQAQ
jgi:ribosomal protein S12 methylthiotransferase